MSDIFVELGEPTFRDLERDSGRQGIADHDGVLALGGGAILDPGPAPCSGTTPWSSRRRLADAVRRVGLARDRPLLIANPRAQLMRLLEARRPLYEEVASITVATDGRGPDDIADEVLAHARA